MTHLIELAKKEYTTDNYGNDIASDITAEVFAEIESVSHKEFFAAGQTDLKADYKAIVWSFEYSGEKTVKYNGKIYAVYRTYEKGDRTELYLTERVGKNERQ